MEHKQRSIIGNVLFDDAIHSTGMRKCDFATKLGISCTHLYDIIRGDRRLTWKIAKRLGEITDKPARDWLALQAEQDLAESRHA
jgi:addiction module HigA family antidote